MNHASSLAAGVAAILVVAGCGSAEAPSQPSTATESAFATTSTPPTTAAPPDMGTVIDVSIAGGAVSPTNAEAEAVAGEPIVLEVTSDAPDSIHVHSVPEYVFEVQPGAGQRFEFTVDVPGQVDIELHDLNRTVVTITVRPR